MMTDTTVTEEELAAKAVGPRVTREELEANIDSYVIFNAGQTLRATVPVSEHANLLTLCVLTTKNGFTVVGESACAWPANYNKEYGERLALDNAKNKLWSLMGYHLKQQLFDGYNEDGPAQLQTPQLNAVEESTDATDATTEASAASEGTWQERLRTEYDDLSTKLDALVDFIVNDPGFTYLADRQARLLIEQREAMQSYFTILEARLHDAGILFDNQP